MSSKKAGKILAVFSALLLGGGFIAFRQMGQEKTPPVPKDDASPPVVLPSSKNPAQVIVLPSSKSISMPIFSPRKLVPDEPILPPFPSEDPTGKKVKRVLLPSSKIGTIIMPEDAATISPATIDAIFDEQDAKPTEEVPPP